MALLPTKHFYLESIQSSLSKFHGTPLLFFRYTCSIPSKSQNLCSNSSSNKNPPRNTLFRKRSSNDLSLSSTSGWFSQWNKPSKQKSLGSPQVVFNYRSDDDGGGYDGGGSGTTMEKIVENLKKYGYIDESVKKERGERVIEKGSVEDIFYVEEGMLPNSRGGFSKDKSLKVENVFESGGEVRFPWEKPKKKEGGEDDEVKWTARSKSRTLLAEMTLPESELRRLRNLIFHIKSKVRVKGSGVTQEVVDAIHEKWKTSEIARVKVEGAPALNMKRMHEILERKTGGLVIWRSGTAVALYRGASYEVPSVHLHKRAYRRNEMPSNDLQLPSPTTNKMTRYTSKFTSNDKLDALQSHSEASSETMVTKEREMRPEVNYEDEVDKLLDGLGPRYTEWPGLDSLPVDADLLPGVVPGFQPPFRILPYGVRSTLAINEATSLRRLARFLPPHFALGRSRQLEGLAAAMVKLWNKSKIAKIALKRGVQLTTSERMAEELKRLTGGMLLSRNKDFLVFYRGKNFLSPEVAEALLERERLAKSLQEEEEQARLRASAFVVPIIEKTEESGIAGTLEETLTADAKWGKKLDDRHKENIMREVEIARHDDLVRKLERKLAFAERKLRKAEYALSKVEAFLKPAERQADPYSISDEERFMFRKLGLRMKAFLLLGRRGVFDGTVENMHLHWKYRELVKLIVKAKSIEQVKKIALALEAESGGVLVSVDKVSKGYAIIVYRGKNYSRPSTLRPKNLLTKRKALARSVEIQRREALLKHISAMETKVNKLRSEIEQMDTVKDHGDEELYDRLDSAYSTEQDDSESEEQGDEDYLNTYNGENEDEQGDDDSETENSTRNIAETDFPYISENEESENETEDGHNEVYAGSYDGESDDRDDEDYAESDSLITPI